MILRVAPWVASALLHTTAVVAFYGGGGKERSAPTDVLVPVELAAEEPVPPAHPAVAPADDAPSTASKAHPRHVHAYPVPADHDARPHSPMDPHVTSAPGDVAPEPVASAAAEPPPVPRFVLSPRGAVHVHGHGDAAAAGTGAPASSQATVIPEALVAVPAKLVASVPAAYPPDARNADEEADVPLEIVVDVSGHVVEARASKAVGLGFEKSALAAIRGYRFSPASRDGQAVAVRMKWVVQFRLR